MQACVEECIKAEHSAQPEQPAFSAKAPQRRYCQSHQQKAQSPVTGFAGHGFYRINAQGIINSTDNKRNEWNQASHKQYRFDYMPNGFVRWCEWHEIIYSVFSGQPAAHSLQNFAYAALRTEEQ
jgi:hypothetical protein